MLNHDVTVFVQFPAMPEPRRLTVSLRDLYFLDRFTERRIMPDGAVIYYPSRELPPVALTVN